MSQLEDDDKSKMMPAVVVPAQGNLLKSYNIKLVFPKDQNKPEQMMKLILKMFTKDTSLMIHVFDLATEEQYPTLMIEEEILMDTSSFN